MKIDFKSFRKWGAGVASGGIVLFTILLLGLKTCGNGGGGGNAGGNPQESSTSVQQSSQSNELVRDTLVLSAEDPLSQEIWVAPANSRIQRRNSFSTKILTDSVVEICITTTTNEVVCADDSPTTKIHWDSILDGKGQVGSFTVEFKDGEDPAKVLYVITKVY